MKMKIGQGHIKVKVIYAANLLLGDILLDHSDFWTCSSVVLEMLNYSLEEEIHFMNIAVAELHLSKVYGT